MRGSSASWRLGTAKVPGVVPRIPQSASAGATVGASIRGPSDASAASAAGLQERSSGSAGGLSMASATSRSTGSVLGPSPSPPFQGLAAQDLGLDDGHGSPGSGKLHPFGQGLRPDAGRCALRVIPMVLWWS
jgi:hypothetical protein